MRIRLDASCFEPAADGLPTEPAPGPARADRPPARGGREEQGDRARRPAGTPQATAAATSTARRAVADRFADVDVVDLVDQYRDARSTEAADAAAAAAVVEATAPRPAPVRDR